MKWYKTKKEIEDIEVGGDVLKMACKEVLIENKFECFDKITSNVMQRAIDKRIDDFEIEVKTLHARYILFCFCNNNEADIYLFDNDEVTLEKIK